MFSHRIITLFVILLSPFLFFSQNKKIDYIQGKAFTWKPKTTNYVKAKDTIEITIFITNDTKAIFEPILSSFNTKNINKTKFIESTPKYYKILIKKDILQFLNINNNREKQYKISIESKNVIKLIELKSKREYLLNNLYKPPSPTIIPNW
ncbi:hypothetical protein [Elizabethkingia anophelis]|uniref:Uncharacterized protein n=1 Tax=Elizabethkingia anophelis TaxID=1117645 RepID=A0A7Z7LSZ6_9FLAO|nr:hypothetical protein [Elizabethkingia anophelis]MCT3629941.1 hypothetical protein [Elizabethkingia anophelis]MCT3633117.1 hypothetical protein [Elizabethkingia anophelis]MCT3816566.1 hypothetical protein [Elizabethkingia anophelis]MCT3830185.1 hypothetical protein [Elizabethkingia anophelis]MCT3873956.1 hypothetical protein [Elizabethkingia anophelis]